MKFIDTFAAPVLLLTPLLFSPMLQAQQPGVQGSPAPQTQGQNQSQRQRRGMDHSGMDQFGEHRSAADREREGDEREQMFDERQDLGELGLPQGAFWLNPELALRIHLTGDQVHRLGDAYLQGRLKIIQLEANEEMEEAKLDDLESQPDMDNTAALAATDRLAEARAATEKADAHLAFALRGVLTADQLAMLRKGYLHGGMQEAHQRTHHPAANTDNSQGVGRNAPPPA